MKEGRPGTRTCPSEYQFFSRAPWPCSLRHARLLSGLSPRWIYEVNLRTFSPTDDFRGVEKRLDYLKDLGVTAGWIMMAIPQFAFGNDP